jgi:DNA-binding PadR family transcriptional regulator
MSDLTEFEGAILMEVARQANVSAFKVRQAFRSSFSSAWSSSAGAVYTAVNRLIDARLLKTTAPLDRRGTRHLELTAAGRRAHRAWIADIEAASSIGSDPFRLRAPGWLELPKRERMALLARLQNRLENELERLTAFAHRQADPHDQVRAVFAIELLRSRLAWLNNLHTGK